MFTESSQSEFLKILEKTFLDLRDFSQNRSLKVTFFAENRSFGPFKGLFRSLALGILVASFSSYELIFELVPGTKVLWVVFPMFFITPEKLDGYGLVHYVL